jgi:hypothetical protein
VSEEHDLAQILVLDEVDDIRYVRLEVYLGAREVHPFA